MKKKRKGFTLAELLIVVAIIAVLVAIGIPIFTSQLEKSREATDAANIRVQYAQVMAEAITVDGNVNIDEITVRTISDGDTLALALQSGEINAAYGMVISVMRSM